MAIEKDFFRQVMGHFTTGVTVVQEGQRKRIDVMELQEFIYSGLAKPCLMEWFGA